MRLIKRHILLLSIIALILGYLGYRLATADPKGYCGGKTYNGANSPYASDEELLLIGMRVSRYVYSEDGKRISNPSIREIKAYVLRHPGCCRVYRDLTEENGPETRNGILRRAFGMKQFVIIAFRELDNILKQPRFAGFERYVTLDTCGAIYSN